MHGVADELDQLLVAQVHELEDKSNREREERQDDEHTAHEQGGEAWHQTRLEIFMENRNQGQDGDQETQQCANREEHQGFVVDE